MSFTRPMPLGEPTASVWAAWMASVATSTAVSNPKERLTRAMSLSMVLGMTMTAMRNSRRAISWQISVGGPEGAVAADEKEDADVDAVQGVHDLAGVLGAPGGGQDGAAEDVDVGHRLGGEVHQVVAVFGDEPLEAVAHPVDVPHLVEVVELQDDGPDDVVGAGAQAAAGDDGAVHLGGVEVDLGPGAGHFKGEGLLSRRQALQVVQGVVDQDLVRVLRQRFFPPPGRPG